MVQGVKARSTSLKVKISVIVAGTKAFDVTKRFELPTKKLALEWITEALAELDKL